MVSMMKLAVPMALVAALMTASVMAADDPPKRCGTAEADKQICTDCLNTGKCPDDATDEDRKDPVTDAGTTCTGGEVCTIIGTTATCVPLYKQDKCVCTPNGQCDAYNPTAVLYCGSNGPFLSEVCSEDKETCIDGECGTPSPDATTVDPAEICKDVKDYTFVAVKPNCTTAVFCKDDKVFPGGLTECSIGLYYDSKEQKCLPAPPMPCEGAKDGASPDRTNCTRYYVCLNGVVEDVNECKDTEKKYFDAETLACDKEEKKCDATIGCTFGLTTVAGGVTGTGPTTTGTGEPSECTAANVGRFYPDPASCKYYRVCRYIGGSIGYKYFSLPCPGSLVFDAVSRKCKPYVQGCNPPPTTTTRRPRG